jgi:glycosyltransferase involved in cell wall biosynthesis
MRIAFFTDTYYPEVNGIVTSILNMTNKLARRGHRIIIFCPKYKGLKEQKLHRNITVRRSFAVPLMTYSDVRIALPNHVKIARELKRFNPDVLHLHTPGLFSVSAIISSKILHKPLVGTFHTLVTEQLNYLSLRNAFMNGSINKFIRQLKRLNTILKKIRRKPPESVEDNIDRLKKNWFVRKLGRTKSKVISSIQKMVSKEKEWNLQTKKMLVWKLLRTVYGQCDITTTPSPSLVKELKIHMIPSRIVYLSNGLDFSLFERKKKNLHTKNIITAGRVSYEKNTDIIVKSMPHILKRHPSATLTIVGDGPALNSLNELTTKLSIEKNVKFTGMVKYKKISEWYLKSDIFATASTMETQGLTILEAMYSGLPAVGVRKYAIPDWIKEGKNGHIVPPGSPEKMAQAITDLLDKPAKAEKYGREAAKTAEKHDIDLIIPKLEELYASLVKKQSI